MKLIDFKPRSILVIRLSAIGDIIMSSALIPALREAYPEARLVWLTEDINADLLRENPGLTKLILWPRRRWRQMGEQRRYMELFKECWVLLGELRRERFDLVLDIQGLLKSGIWAWLSGCKTRIGLGSREGSQWLMTKTLDTRTERPLIGGEYLKLVQALGLSPCAFPMSIAPSAECRKQAMQLLDGFGVNGPYAVICPFTTRPQKHWFEERWGELARRLMEQRGLSVVMLGGPGDREAAKRIADQAPRLADLTGATSLIQCASIIERASLLVGVDTGLTHLGIAMRTPTLALFGSTRPYLDTGVDYAKVLYEALPCSPCKRRPTCGGHYDCMRRHTVETIMVEASKLQEIKN